MILSMSRRVGEHRIGEAADASRCVPGARANDAFDHPDECLLMDMFYR